MRIPLKVMEWNTDLIQGCMQTELLYVPEI